MDDAQKYGLTPRAALSSLTPYAPGDSIQSIQKQHNISLPIIKLASNENPLGSALQPKELSQTLKDVFRYPDSNNHPLLGCLSAHFKIENDQIIFGNGSDEIFQLICLAYCEPGDAVISSEHTFSVYKAATLSMGASYTSIPMKDFSIDLAGIIDVIDKRTKVIFLANPNNPTGGFIDYYTLKQFLTQIPPHVLVVIDEAYKEYVSTEPLNDTINFLKSFHNVLITRTYSKIYGLAGLRIGYGLSTNAIVNTLQKVRAPFNVNNLALEAAYICQTHKQAFLKTAQDINIAGLEQYKHASTHWPARLLPTEANFICLILDHHKADDAYNFLLKEGIIIRKLNSFGLPNGIRITISTHSDNERCIQGLNQFFKQP